MKNRRLTLDVISILTSFFASIFFVFPIWHFTSTTTHDDKTTILTTNKVHLFDKASLNLISDVYKTHNKSIDPFFAHAFEIMSAFWVSRECADVRSYSYTNWKQYGGRYLKDYEIVLVNLFK
jgi:hypothetical protein